MAIKSSTLLQTLKLTPKIQIRLICKNALAKIPKLKLNEDIEKSLEEKVFKVKKHPGIIKNKLVPLPDWILKGMDLSLEDIVRPQLLRESGPFFNYLFSRQLPKEDCEVKEMYSGIEARMLTGKLNGLSTDEIEEKRRQIKEKVNLKLKEKVYGWKPMEYTSYRSLLYMITRSLPEFSVLHTIFNEIRVRDPDFDPHTMFDFGSGVGSVLWAASAHWNKITEYLGVDISSNMNDLSENILKQFPEKPAGVFYRQYLPVSNLKHDLVVSAYSLMELPDSKNRLSTITKLWKKTGKYLVIVEQGTNAGFKLVNEAREIIKHIEKADEGPTEYFTFAPCPHDLACPRFGGEKQTPCNFILQYNTLPLLGPSRPVKELYSYVVLKKGGKRKEEDSWHRLVRPTIAGSKHARCRLCTSDGKLQEVIFTASKYGKPTYRFARVSRWGDRLPMYKNPEYENAINGEETLSTDTTEHNDEESHDEDESEVEEQVNEIKFCSQAPVTHVKTDNP